MKSNETKIVLTKPFATIENQSSDSDGNYTAPNMLQQVLSLFKNVRLGSDLSRFKVSHHPQVSAFHATDQKGNIEIRVCHSPVPKFVGTGVEVDMHGKRELHLHNHGETYEMNCPNFLFRFLPVPGIDWVGNVTIRCQQTGLVAELSYIRQYFFGFGGNRRRIKGKIFDSLTKNVFYKVDGHWDRYLSQSHSKVLFAYM